MKNFFKNNKNSKTLNEVISRLDKMENDINNLSKSIKNINNYKIFDIIGYQNSNNLHFKLLAEAKSRGFFEPNNYFVPVDGWKDTAYFKHDPSNCPSNYCYYVEKDILHIPVIGIRGNFSWASVSIYKAGKWAEVYTNE